MSESELLAWFQEYFFRQLGVRRERVALNANFEADLGVDSIDYTGLLLDLERDLNVNIPDAEVPGLVTVGDAVRFLAARPNTGTTRGTQKS